MVEHDSDPRVPMLEHGDNFITVNKHPARTKSPCTDTIGVRFENISYAVAANPLKLWNRGSKSILKNVSGDFEGGRFTAVIGPSGGGKSTLMDIISGYRLDGVSGEIYINGRRSDIRRLTKQSCYIMQDNELQPLITVQEAMTFAANVKLPRDTSNSERQSKIAEILENFSLEEHLHTITNRLSGGQRKRLSIAIELISNPAVLFLDEPTSGLDSKSAKQCLEILGSLTSEGRTVICSIHQPSSAMLNLFDNAYFLTNGQCVYQGSVANIVSYLSAIDLECPLNNNPVEFVIELSVFGDVSIVELLVQACENGKSQRWFSSSGNAVVESANSEPDEKGDKSIEQSKCRKKTNTPFLWQVLHLLNRSFLISSRDPFLTYLAIGSNIVVGFVLGGFFYNYGNDGGRVLINFNLLVLCILFTMYNAMASRVITFPQSLPVIRREYFNRWYSLKAYFLASSISDIPLHVLCVTIFMSIVFWLSNQPFELFRFCMPTFVIILVSLMFQDYGIMMGTLLDMETGLIAAMFTTFPIVMFSGFLLYRKDSPDMYHYFFATSPLRRAVELVVSSVYGFDRKPLTCPKVFCVFRYPDFFMKQVDIQPENYVFDLLYLFGTLIVFKFLSFLAFVYRIYYRK